MSDDQRSQSQFVSSAIGRSNKAVTQIARDAKSTAFITGRRVTADEAGKKDGGCSSAARICGRRETDRLGDGLGRLDAGNSTAITERSRERSWRREILIHVVIGTRSVIEIRSNNAVLGLYVDIRFLQKFITGYLQHIYRSSGSRYRQNFYLKPLSRTLEVLHFRVNRASPTCHARLQSRFEGAFPF